ncbi:MAG: MFS transporter [Alphaproteobacteria bacterium]|nr:MFS transporter [Alphaproteobacteria bacterium]
MSSAASSAPAPVEEQSVPAWLTLLLATVCGLVAANIYYAQPLVGPISAAIGLSPGAAGLIVTFTQIGYGAGLLFVVPLGDLLENRILVFAALADCTLALLAAAFAPGATSFLAAALFIGFGAVAIQILVPYAAHLAPAAMRGRVVGNVMSGLLLGIMMARPVSSLVTDLLGWRAIFILSALVTGGLALLLLRVLPKRRPSPGLNYAGLLFSMAVLFRSVPVLRRRAAYQAGLFGAFSLFWTTAPLYLAGPAFNLTQRGIALFALAGVAGAISAPIAGRLADKGWSRPVTGIAIASVAAAFIITHIGRPGSSLALAMLVAAAIVLDFGVSANLVSGQRAIFSLGAEFRARLNGVYMAIFFAGGAVGSALGAWAYAQGGWLMASSVGLALPVLALLYFTTERRAG